MLMIWKVIVYIVSMRVIIKSIEVVMFLLVILKIYIYYDD